MKNNKVSGSDEILIVMLIGLDDLGIEKVAKMINEIYDSNEILEDFSKSVFIVVPKKLDAKEYECH